MVKFSARGKEMNRQVYRTGMNYGRFLQRRVSRDETWKLPWAGAAGGAFAGAGFGFGLGLGFAFLGTRFSGRREGLFGEVFAWVAGLAAAENELDGDFVVGEELAEAVDHEALVGVVEVGGVVHEQDD